MAKKLTRVLTPVAAVAALALLAAVTIVATALLLRSVSARGAGGGSSATAASAQREASAPARPSTPKPVRRQPDEIPPRAAVRLPSRVDAGGESDEALMEKLRGLAGRDPEQILRLAREANARDPHGPNAAERGWMVVKSLTDLQRFSEAKDEAQAMVNRYPGTSWALDVQRHLLSNPL